MNRRHARSIRFAGKSQRTHILIFFPTGADYGLPTELDLAAGSTLQELIVKSFLIAGIAGAVLFLSNSAHAADTNCQKTGGSNVFTNEYARATHAWCQDNSKATYMLVSLLQAITQAKASFVGGSGDLINVTGFTAIALGGYKLDAGMIHRRDGKKFISVHFTDPNNSDVKYYNVTYQVDESVFGDPIQK